MLNISYSKCTKTMKDILNIFSNNLNRFCLNIQYKLMLVGGSNFAQLTSWELYFDCAALQAVHYFAKKLKLTL